MSFELAALLVYLAIACIGIALLLHGFAGMVNEGELDERLALPIALIWGLIWPVTLGVFIRFVIQGYKKAANDKGRDKTNDRTI